MAIKRFTSNKDNTITNAYKFDLQKRATSSNMGQSDIVEVFSIFGQQSKKSVEKMRTLIDFPIKEIAEKRGTGNIPKSGSVNFVLRLFNAEHGQSVPKNFVLDVLPVAQEWDEGYGLDMETFLDTGASNWLSCSDAASANINKFTFVKPNAYDYRLGSISLYEPGGDRSNFWFKHHATASAPSLAGEEYEVDVIGKTTAIEVAAAFTNTVNAINGYLATGNGPSVTVTNTTSGIVTAYSLNSFQAASTVTGETTQSGSSAVLWTSEGGSTWNLNNIVDSGFSSYSQNFTSGREDLELDITGLVEEWIKGETGVGLTKATGSFTFTNTPADNSNITLISTDGLKREYRFMSSGIANAEVGTSDSSVIFIDTSSGNTTTIATNFVNAVKTINAHDSRFTITSNSALVKLTQSLAGFGGNTKITTAGSQPNITADANLGGGAGAINNGMLVSLQGLYEEGTLATSFYTKKFFARGSEFELKRPVIEARWNSAVTDDRNDFYLSSSLLNAQDNLNSIYLYNYFRGSLNNLPVIGTGSMFVKFFDTDGTEITTSTPRNPITASYFSKGIYRAQVALTTNSTKVTDAWFFERSASGSITTTGNPGNNQTFTLKNTAQTSITFVFKTDSNIVSGAKDGDNVIIGVQTAVGSAAAVSDRIAAAINASDINITATAVAGGTVNLVQKVKGAAGNNQIISAGVDTVTFVHFTNGFSNTEYHRGEIYPKTHLSKGHRPDFNYVSKILNLKPSYNPEEKPRLRLYIRERDWSPNIYTVASKKIETAVIKNAYYKISRVADDFPVISYGTGSVEYTKLSYDVSGSYFDVDMSIFEKGHLYEISIVYNLDNDYKEQNDKFRFRVDQ